jgi:hypothetical protein
MLAWKVRAYQGGAPFTCFPLDKVSSPSKTYSYWLPLFPDQSGLVFLGDLYLKLISMGSGTLPSLRLGLELGLPRPNILTYKEQL